MSSIAVTSSRPAPAAEPARSRAEATAAGPVWIAALLFYAAMLPREIRLQFGQFVIFPDRAYMYAMTPFILMAIARGALRFRPIDTCVFGAAAWMIVAMMANYGFADGLERGGAQAFDTVLAYLIGRISVRSLHDLRRLLVFVAPGFAISGGIMLLESVSRRLILQPLAQSVFGPLPVYLSGEEAGVQNRAGEIRLGLMRAQAGFPHSILAGVFLASGLGLYLFGWLKMPPKMAGIAGSLFGFFSLSSAAILALMVTAGLTAYEFLQRRIRELNWPLLIGAVIAVATVIQIASKSGLVSVFVRYFTLSPATGYFRTLIWEYGLLSVSNYPIFGIGFEGYERPTWVVTESIDAHWLLLAVRYGIPSALLLTGFFVGAITLVARASSRLPMADLMTMRGLAFALVTLFLTGFTVAFTGGIFAYFIALAGIGITISHNLQTQAAAGPQTGAA
ncbi:O-antigen ligase family protein [Paraurantiacibacter namhicola]|uniref:O-Antigen ligase n=1 Tax=Paraurantiacibacter namhicola TaxID=645517 RepID=A0A1C7D750_9SPHN|nr:O-antigen ligase family protein [Paraurantiacibacter namhicola]ANU07151.1 hypothetical protein A6F65_00833 [Paraurantiacibacter namhicola]